MDHADGGGSSNARSMPALFVGHGSPMNVTLDNPFTRSLQALGTNLPRPAAILVVSAHWLTRGTYVTCMEHPRTIHDFYGFPPELYEIRYPSAGSPSYAGLVRELAGGQVVRCDSDWGLDHASWAILHHMVPAADVPVLELSLDYSQPAAYHFELGAHLVGLRDEGVLVIGSGNIVHNLRLADYDHIDAPAFGWALEFDAWVQSCWMSGDAQSLIDAEHRGSVASLAVPTPDHYLPMLYVLALRREGDAVAFPHQGFQHASISMRSILVGG